jgi:hypothetical protein
MKPFWGATAYCMWAFDLVICMGWLDGRILVISLAIPTMAQV